MRAFSEYTRRPRVKPTRIILAVAAIAATACSRPGSEERALQWTGDLPEGAVVHLRNGSGSIEVKRAEGQRAEVIGAKQWRRGRARDIDFVVQSHGNEYYVCAMWRNSGSCSANGYRGKNTRTFLSMFSLFNRNTDATADIVAELPANVVVDAVNNTGDVNIEGITGGVRARTVNGDVEAENVGGKVTLESTNGDVKMTTEPGASIGAIALNTTNGDVHAELPHDVQGAFDISTVNGDVRSEFALEPTSKSEHARRFRGQIGAAERSIKLRSVNGSVVLARLAPASHP